MGKCAYSTQTHQREFKPRISISSDKCQATVLPSQRSNIINCTCNRVTLVTHIAARGRPKFCWAKLNTVVSIVRHMSAVSACSSSVRALVLCFYFLWKAQCCCSLHPMTQWLTQRLHVLRDMENKRRSGYTLGSDGLHDRETVLFFLIHKTEVSFTSVLLTGGVDFEVVLLY